jgi:hypothetical protein
MATDNLKDLYAKLFEKVKQDPKVQEFEFGILYKTIQTVLGEEQPPEKIQEIFKNYRIKPDNLLNDDFEISLKIIFDSHLILWQLLIPLYVYENAKEKIDSLQSFVIRFLTPIAEKIPIPNINIKEKKMELIFAAAIIIAAPLLVWKVYLDPKAKQNTIIEEPIQKPTLPSSSPGSAELCLIIPASIANGVKNVLSSDDLITLIYHASYFLCTDFDTANRNQKELNMAETEEILPNSNREVYIRIKIDNGGNMIGQKMPYSLKINLPENVQVTVEKLACLRDLSGLEKFNRV